MMFGLRVCAAAPAAAAEARKARRVTPYRLSHVPRLDRCAREAELVGSGLHGSNAERDVFIEIDTEFGGVVADIVAAAAAVEVFVLELLSDRCGVHLVEALAGLDVVAGGEKAGQF